MGEGSEIRSIAKDGEDKHAAVGRVKENSFFRVFVILYADIFVYDSIDNKMEWMMWDEEEGKRDGS
jgi:hypothetical protein